MLKKTWTVLCGCVAVSTALAGDPPVSKDAPKDAAPAKEQQAADAKPETKPETKAGAQQVVPALPKVGPPVSNRPFDASVKARTAIPAAAEAARALGQRVLVVWGKNDAPQTERFVRAWNMPDNRKVIAMEYQTVFVDVSDSPTGDENWAMAPLFNIKAKRTEDFPVLVVLEGASAPVVSRSSASFLDNDGRIGPLKLQDFLFEFKQVQPSGREALDAALAAGKAAGKNVLVRFYEFGDAWCDRFEELLAMPELHAVLSARFEVLRLHIQRNEGSADMFAEMAPKAESYPWYAVLDSTGKVVVASQPEGGRNIGYPSDDGELEQFVAMLKKGSPGLSAEDERAIKDAVVKLRGKK